MFEKFQVKGFYICPQAVLSLYSSGRTNGLVIDSGEGSSNAVPVYEGFIIDHAVKRNFIAGKAITDYFATLLS
jgi:actin-related protein|tara:strand:- start:600 stop:818 length:219 start_codon:yes stop_codon:yes gene_type:complete